MKRLVDLLGCGLALPVAVPLCSAIAVAIKLDSTGPALYRGRRVGRDGQPFDILKFRTMTHGAVGPAVTTAGDPRITRVGRFLRATKLDELPQIVNVLLGEMSLVGPRPEDPRYVAAYTEEQRQVLTVPPGLTSAALLRFGNEQAYIERAQPGDVEEFYLRRLLPEKLEIELAYVRAWTLTTDLRILARTLSGIMS